MPSLKPPCTMSSGMDTGPAALPPLSITRILVPPWPSVSTIPGSVLPWDWETEGEVKRDVAPERAVQDDKRGRGERSLAPRLWDNTDLGSNPCPARALVRPLKP